MNLYFATISGPVLRYKGLGIAGHLSKMGWQSIQPLYGKRIEKCRLGSLWKR